MPRDINRDVTITLTITVNARENETDNEVKRWLVSQVYEIADVDNIEVEEDN